MAPPYVALLLKNLVVVPSVTMILTDLATNALPLLSTNETEFENWTFAPVTSTIPNCISCFVELFAVNKVSQKQRTG